MQPVRPLGWRRHQETRIDVPSLRAVSLRPCAALLVAVITTSLAGAAWADPAVPVLEGYRMDNYRTAVPDTVPGAAVLHTAEVQALVASGGAVLVDVLPAPRRPDAMRPGVPWLPPRHLGLPGSLWWPEVGRGALPPATEARLRQRLQEVSADRPGGLVVFYCLPDCWMSWNAARRAAAMGVRAAWYPEGVDGWIAAGLPMEELRAEVLE